MVSTPLSDFLDLQRLVHFLLAVSHCGLERSLHSVKPVFLQQAHIVVVFSDILLVARSVVRLRGSVTLVVEFLERGTLFDVVALALGLPYLPSGYNDTTTKINACWVSGRLVLEL